MQLCVIKLNTYKAWQRKALNEIMKNELQDVGSYSFNKIMAYFNESRQYDLCRSTTLHSQF